MALIALGRYHREGNSYVVIIPPKIRSALGLFPGDVLAMRLLGPCLIMERVPLEKLANPKDQPVPLYGANRS